MSTVRPVTLLDAKTSLAMPLNGIKLIEASAGTGKTYTIANLYLRHVLAGRRPRDILVVTFTNAATDELRGRIRQRLFDALQVFRQHEPLDDEFLQLLLENLQVISDAKQQLQEKHLQLALRSMDEAAIYTIHGFCQRALVDNALYTGQTFNASLLTDDSELRETALRDWWRCQSYQLDSAKLNIFYACVDSFSTFKKNQSVLNTNRPYRLLPEVSEDLSTLFTKWQGQQQCFEELAALWYSNRAMLEQILRDSVVLSRTKKLPYHQDNLAAFLDRCDEFFHQAELPGIPDDIRYLSSTQLHQDSMPSRAGEDENLNHLFFTSIDDFLTQVKQYRIRFNTRASFEAHAYAGEHIRRSKLSSDVIAYDDLLNHLSEGLSAPAGERLAQSIRDRYPVAMIDEFQDTDATQYDIFYRIYFHDDASSFTMIGDPKQAIYSFRGGDIFTYIQARQHRRVDIYTLQTNWRSDTALVGAVNHLFSRRSDPFIYSDAIQFSAVTAAHRNDRASLLIDQIAVPPITIWKIPERDDARLDSKANSYEKIYHATAREIFKLISAGKNGLAMLDQSPLQSGDIAVLVRTGYEGNALRDVLSDYGINAITIGRDKVFNSDEATGLLRLLEAISHYAERHYLRAALASSLLGLDYQTMSARLESEGDWQRWITVFRHLNHLWLRKGFTVMFQHLLQELQIGENMAAQPRSERRMTNLLHLAELLQQRCRRTAGLDALLAWFRREVDSPSTEESELRLESDRDLVRIVTIHKSKGLEYPVVFLPCLWTTKPRDLSGASPLEFHDQNNKPVIDIGSDNFDQHAIVAEKERLAEDLRLVYVALTRARTKIYLVWGKIDERSKNSSPAKTALGFLLHPRQSAKDLDTQIPRAYDLDHDIDGDINALCDSSHGGIEYLDLPDREPMTFDEIASPEPSELRVARFQVNGSRLWKIASFSALTHDIHQVYHQGSRDMGNDPIINFPAGSQVGLLLHQVFELLDFGVNISGQSQTLIRQYAPRFGIELSDRQLAILGEWFAEILQTPLQQPGLSLSVISNQQRLNELSFDFSVEHLDTGALNLLLADFAHLPIEALSAQSFRGLITGIIDLVFEYQGKYYLADYKSNFLGPRLQDYSPDCLHRAMLDRRYDLQSLIYTIALHRYLQQRIEGYDYNQHFGGSYYLFLRGMRKQHGTDFGIHFERPSLSQIRLLEQNLCSPVPEAKQG